MRTAAQCMEDMPVLTDDELAQRLDPGMVQCIARDAAPSRDGKTIVMIMDFSPAYAQAAAAHRLGGPVEFRHMNYAGLPVYTLEVAP
jgi:hypothetical protein